MTTDATLFNFQEFVRLAKHHKMAWVHSTQRGDMNPTVVGIKDGKPTLLVVAPQLDKYEGLNACNILRRGLGINSVILVTDGHTILTNGKSPEEVQRLYEKYAGKPGSMQRACDEEGACSLGEIADCLCVHYLSEDGRFFMGSYPYDYHGKDGGVEFNWMPEHNQEMLDCPIMEEEELEEARANNNVPEAVISGIVPCSLKAIMAQPSIFEDPQAQAAFKIFGITDPAKFAKQMEIATRRQLLNQDFIVMEVLTIGNSFEEFMTDMADTYEKAMAARSPMIIASPEEMMEQLDALERAATEAQDDQAVREIRRMRDSMKAMEDQ